MNSRPMLFKEILVTSLFAAVLIAPAEAFAGGGPCKNSTVAYWRFDGDYIDSCGDIHGTPEGDAHIEASNYPTLCGNSGTLVLDGDGDRVNLPAPFSFGPLPEGTIEGWVYLDESNKGGTVLHHTTIGNTSTDLILGFNLAEDGWELLIHMAAGAYSYFPLGDCFGRGAWHHVAVTWDGTNVEGFLDGKSLGSQGNNDTPQFTGGAAYIGGHPVTTHWAGHLDEIRLSNVVLQPSKFLLGESCPADFNGDGAVGPADLAILLASWGACD